VDYDGFLSMVDQQTGIGRAAAERATRATLFGRAAGAATSAR